MKTNPLAPDFEKIVCTIHGVRYGYCPECLFGKPSDAFGEDELSPAAKEDGIPEEPRKYKGDDLCEQEMHYFMNGSCTACGIPEAVASLQEPERELQIPPLDENIQKSIEELTRHMRVQLADIVAVRYLVANNILCAIDEREKQLASALSELRKLRSQESK